MIVIYAIGDDEIRDKNAEIEKLLAEISCGNASATGALYDLIKTDVFAYALSKTGNKADAEDVMQNVFLQIYKNATRYVPEGKPMAWIFTVEINLIRRFFKIKSRTTALDEKAANYAAAESPETTAVNNSFLRELLKTLTEEERAAAQAEYDALKEEYDALKDEYKAAVEELKEQAKEKTRELKDEIRERAEQRREEFAEKIHEHEDKFNE